MWTRARGSAAPDVPDPGHCWFDYDDTRIRPIDAAEIERQFAGKESAYMLCYRRKSLQRPPDGTWARRRVTTVVLHVRCVSSCAVFKIRFCVLSWVI